MIFENTIMKYNLKIFILDLLNFNLLYMKKNKVPRLKGFYNTTRF